MKKLDRSAVRLVDSTDERLAEVLPAELAVELGAIAGLCREGLMAVAVEAGLATAMAMMGSEVDVLCGSWNARDPERTHVRGGSAPTSVIMGRAAGKGHLDVEVDGVTPVRVWHHQSAGGVDVT